MKTANKGICFLYEDAKLYTIEKYFVKIWQDGIVRL